MVRRVIAGIALVGLGLGAGLLLRPRANESAPAVAQAANAAATPAVGFQVGMQAPDFMLTDLNGDEVRLSALRGKPVFINFWASWCPPCRIEMPDMQKFWLENGEQVHMLAVNQTGTEKSPDTPRQYLKEKGFTFPVLFDVDGDVASSYGVRGLPTSFFLDANGVIRAVSLGAMDLATMKANLAKAQRGGR